MSEKAFQLHKLCNIDYVCLICVIKDIPQPDGIIDIANTVDEKCEEFDLADDTRHSECEELDQNNTIVEQLLLEQHR